MEFNAMEASAKRMFGYIIRAKLDEEAWEAKKNGKLVCWSASVAPPPEFLCSYGYAMVYPETHAAGAGARKSIYGSSFEVADEKATTLISAHMHVQTWLIWNC